MKYVFWFMTQGRFILLDPGRCNVKVLSTYFIDNFNENF